MELSGRVYAALVAITLIASGCAQTLRFKAVDARNGRPLANVHTRLEKWSWNDFRDRFGRSYGETNLPTSQPDGTITAKVSTGWSRRTTFYFSKTGYSDVWCTYHGFEGSFERPTSTNAFYLLMNVHFREKNGIVTVPLCPQDVLTTSSWPYSEEPVQKR